MSVTVRLRRRLVLIQPLGFCLFAAAFLSSAATTASSPRPSLLDTAPSVITHPVNQTVLAGTVATFTAGASGTPTPTVQWQISTNDGVTWNDLPGATTDICAIVATSGDHGKRYRAVFSNVVGTATTTSATLLLTGGPALTTHPLSRTVALGTVVTFTAAASGVPAPSVYWQKSTDGGSVWLNIVGASAPTYSLTAASGDSGSQFRAVFSNSVGSVATDAATLTVVPARAPTITSQPVDQTVEMSKVATFSAAADGDPTPTVRWQVRIAGSSTWSDIIGATSSTYSFTTLREDSGSLVRAVFTNAGGSTTTGAATLTVTLPPGTPTVSSVTPTQGYNFKSVTVTISGSDFEATPAVKLNNTPLSDVEMPDSHTVTATVPSNLLPGHYDVTVTNPNGLSHTLVAGFSGLASRGGHLGTWRDTTAPPIGAKYATYAKGRLYAADDALNVYRSLIAPDGSLSAWQAVGPAPPIAGGAVTALFSDNSYLWVGTDAGTIVATIDSDGSLSGWRTFIGAGVRSGSYVKYGNNVLSASTVAVAYDASADFVGSHPACRGTLLRLSSDGTVSVLADGLSPGAGGVYPRGLAAVGEFVYFLAESVSYPNIPAIQVLSRSRVAEDGSLGAWVRIAQLDPDGKTLALASGGYLYRMIPNGLPSGPSERAQVQVDGSLSSWTRVEGPSGYATSWVAGDGFIYAIGPETTTFAEFSPLTIAGITPSAVLKNGGTTIELAGTDFLPDATVTVGGIAASSVTFVEMTKMTAVVPAHAAGVVDVVVSNPDGRTVTLAQGLTYVETHDPACSFQLSTAGATFDLSGGTGSLNVAASSPACQWATGSTAPWLTVTSSTSSTGNGAVQYRVAPTNARRLGSLSAAGQTFTVSQGPSIATTPRALVFGATSDGGSLSKVSRAQTVTVSVSGPPGGQWTAVSDQPWVQVAEGAGTNTGQFIVSVAPSPSLPTSGSLMTAITISSAEAVNSPLTIPVTLNITESAASPPPFGFFDLPGNGVTGLEGSFPVTGWALDDVEVAKVQIYRDFVAGSDPPAAANPDRSHPAYGQVYVADALFVNGTRPDIEGAYGSFPLAYRAGWGYLLLSWGLPNHGNGTYKLHAYAYDLDGHITPLGSKTIGVDNAHTTKPFGAIDTPSYGGIATGAAFINYGWALTPNRTPSCTILNGSVGVSIDSGPPVTVSFGDLRDDIASLFIGFTNQSNAGGQFVLDTTKLTDGMHTISWVATDDCGRAEGIGSRYFWVLNSTGVARTAEADQVPVRAARREASGVTASQEPISVRQTGGEWQTVWPDSDGTHVIGVSQVGRIEVQLPPSGGSYEGYQMVGNERRTLPLGSTLDTKDGVYYWQPAPGFLGSFELVFAAPGGRVIRARIVVHPAAHEGR